MGGTLALLARRGMRVGVVDLTRGELGTNGTPEGRVAEADAAGRILGLAVRRNLGLADRGLPGPDGLPLLVGLLRALRPRLVFAPCPEDPHPDHTAAWQLAAEACFSSALRKLPGGEPWEPRTLIQYPINAWPTPSLAVDVGQVYDLKRRAVAAHESQFGPGGIPTRLNSGAAFAQVEARDRFWGVHLGVELAEGFVFPRPVLAADIAALLG